MFPGEFAQPDAMIAKAGAFLGDDVYSGTGTGQALSLTRPPTKLTRFTVRIQNDGDSDDIIIVAGEAPDSGFRLVVWRDGADVTRGYLHGGFRIPLPPGGSEDLVFGLTAKAATVPGTVEERLVTAQSTNDVGAIDAVLLRLIVR